MGHEEPGFSQAEDVIPDISITVGDHGNREGEHLCGWLVHL